MGVTASLKALTTDSRIHEKSGNPACELPLRRFDNRKIRNITQRLSGSPLRCAWHGQSEVQARLPERKLLIKCFYAGIKARLESSGGKKLNLLAGIDAEMLHEFSGCRRRELVYDSGDYFSATSNRPGLSSFRSGAPGARPARAKSSRRKV
jgi:hypothetical protein